MVVVATSLGAYELGHPSAISGTIYFSDYSSVPDSFVIRSYYPGTLNNDVISGTLLNYVCVSPVFNKTQLAVISVVGAGTGALLIYDPVTKTVKNCGSPPTGALHYHPGSGLPSLNSNTIFVCTSYVE